MDMELRSKNLNPVPRVDERVVRDVARFVTNHIINVIFLSRHSAVSPTTFNGHD